jgi:S-formylglutathione hydrolase FrmB
VAALLLAALLAVPAPRAEAAVTLVADEVLSDDGRLHELTLHSEVLGRPTRVRMLLPTGYDDPSNAAARYPVLLLLHGATSDHATWTRLSDIEGHSADDDVIIVMPEGGAFGFYSDWLDGPAWETYHLDELLPWVESTYRAVGTRTARAVAGVSMGGFGAMSYAARHPDRFVAVGSFSGVVDLTGLAAAETAVLQSIFIAPPELWGPFLTHEATWRSHNPADLARNLRGVAIHHTTSTGVPCVGDDAVEGPIEAIVYVMNLSLDHQLTIAGVDHDFVVRPCGTHGIHYPDRDVGAWLTVLDGILAAPPPPPSAFDYRTAEPSFDVWGWSFAVQRPARELLDLHAVSPAGLTVTGSGSVEVASPPDYEPGASYRVTSSSASVATLPVGLVPALGTGAASPPTTTTSTADAEGRLRFTVDLGPAHTANQFSPEGILAEALALGTYYRSATITIHPMVGDAPTTSTMPTTSTTSAAAPSPDGAQDGDLGAAASARGQGPIDALPATGRSTSPVPALFAVAAAALAWRAGARMADGSR